MVHILLLHFTAITNVTQQSPSTTTQCTPTALYLCHTFHIFIRDGWPFSEIMEILYPLRRERHFQKCIQTHTIYTRSRQTISFYLRKVSMMPMHTTHITYIRGKKAHINRILQLLVFFCFHGRKHDLSDINIDDFMKNVIDFGNHILFRLIEMTFLLQYIN